jgi:hypothetical protein
MRCGRCMQFRTSSLPVVAPKCDIRCSALKPAALLLCRRWYGKHAVVIKESSNMSEVTEQLTQELLKQPRPITQEELKEVGRLLPCCRAAVLPALNAPHSWPR